VDSKDLFSKSLETTQIEKELRKAELGQIISYEHLTDVLGRDVRQWCRHNLQSARRILSSEGYEFGVVLNVGLKRLAPNEVVDTNAVFTERIRRTTTRGLKRLSHIVLDDLDDEHKTRLNAQAAHLQFLAHASKPKAAKAIEQASTPSDRPNIGQTLKLFGAEDRTP